MIFIFYILASLLMYLSYKSFRGGINYLDYFHQELAKPASDFVPFATVIAPCKGLEEGLKENLGALLAQDYPKYEVIFVVDREDDPATDVIRTLINGRSRTKLIVSQKAERSSQKVENIREAVVQASTESDVFVFVDSDARTSEIWLRSLVSGLAGKGVGATTGYRWYFSGHPGFASEIRSVWNASIASSLGSNEKSNFCWGGSMAIRREVFEKLQIGERLAGVVSDDFTVTRMIKDAGLAIRFVPQAMTASRDNCDLRELLEFTTRQMKLTRVYAPHLWKLSFLGSALFNIVITASIAILIFERTNYFAIAAAALTLLIVTILSVGKASLRLSAVRLVLPQHRGDLRAQIPTQLTFWSIAPLLFLYNCVAAAFSRTIVWRGVTYEMLSPTETRVSRRS